MILKSRKLQRLKLEPSHLYILIPSLIFIYSSWTYLKDGMEPTPFLDPGARDDAALVMKNAKRFPSIVMRKNSHRIQSSVKLDGADSSRKGQEAVQGTIVSAARSSHNNLMIESTSACEVPPLSQVEQFISYGKDRGKIVCSNMAEFGGEGRFSKPEIWPYNKGARFVCLDLLQRENCTVLSFGNRLDLIFEENMEFDAQCEVYVFDPATNMRDHRRSQSGVFYSLGISDKTGMEKVGGKLNKVDRYENILNMLDLSEKKIDYLKLDVDESDLKVLSDLLKTPHLLQNVQQIGMEIHPLFHQGTGSFLQAAQLYWKAMFHLECLGFTLISYVPNLFPECKFTHNNKLVSGCYDLVYARVPGHHSQNSL